MDRDDYPEADFVRFRLDYDRQGSRRGATCGGIGAADAAEYQARLLPESRFDGETFCRHVLLAADLLLVLRDYEKLRPKALRRTILNLPTTFTDTAVAIFGSRCRLPLLDSNQIRSSIDSSAVFLPTQFIHALST